MVPALLSFLCVVMLAFWSPSSIAAHFAFCFTSCVVMLAFWSPSADAHFAFCLLVMIKSGSGPRVKLVSCKSALNPPVVYSTDRFKAVIPMLVLLCVAL